MEVEVLSVSCGHCHTLAVTNNGVYAWGSSQFGQLGLGKVLQCSTPELITSLAQEVIIDAVAGQYHSVALTADGRVFTWGWGVHGQLGHGNTDKKMTPTLVTSLLGTVIRYITAGHAHTLALSTEGIVYAFGCNIFGQLGVGSNVKSSVPMKVSLSERITLITTGYFHNVGKKVYWIMIIYHIKVNKRKDYTCLLMTLLFVSLLLVIQISYIYGELVPKFSDCKHKRKNELEYWNNET